MAAPAQGAVGPCAGDYCSDNSSSSGWDIDSRESACIPFLSSLLAPSHFFSSSTLGLHPAPWWLQFVGLHLAPPRLQFVGLHPAPWRLQFVGFHLSPSVHFHRFSFRPPRLQFVVILPAPWRLQLVGLHPAPWRLQCVGLHIAPPRLQFVGPHRAPWRLQFVGFHLSPSVHCLMCLASNSLGGCLPASRSALSLCPGSPRPCS